MKCEFEYCIYNKEECCMLKSVSIDMQGTCEECITVFLDKDFLKRQKEDQLKSIEQRWLDL